MSQILVDEHLSPTEVVKPLQRWITAQKIEDFAPDSTLKDERILQILCDQKRVTFVTLDAGFYRKKYCDRRYCLIFFVLPHQEQGRLPSLLRRLFHLSEFKTGAARMGKVVRISRKKIEFWQAGDEKRHRIGWTAAD